MVGAGVLPFVLHMPLASSASTITFAFMGWPVPLSTTAAASQMDCRISVFMHPSLTSGWLNRYYIFLRNRFPRVPAAVYRLSATFIKETAHDAA